MIRSMTGFGRSKIEIEGKEYNVEIRSVNHKYTDISVKLPRQISYLEDKIRKTIADKISRGKIDIFVGLQDYSENGKDIKINREIAKAYINEFKALAEETGISQDINIIDIAKLPEVLNIKNEENEDEIWNEVSTALNLAIDNFIEMREIEGKKIKEDLKNRIKYVSDKVEEIKKYSSGLIEEYIVKLENRIKELLKTDVVDKDRLAQEIVIFSDKSSIEEELTRLDSHINQFVNLLEKDSPVGKKFDFIIQEMNREVNTIGSKANCLEITNRVIELKTEIENIREQIQNIE
ncbi:MAG: YicC family protein [Clostridia bacterium]|nr:YicC family protein [Clostridia bacterium]